MNVFSRLIVLAALIWAGGASATIYTANNNPNRPKGDRVFSTVDSAIAVAAEGDTIHVVPSNSDYGSATINKRLVILGIGLQPDKDIQMLSRISSPNVANSAGIGANPNGSVVEGIWMETLTLNSVNLVIRRCQINTYLNITGVVSGFIVSHCIVATIMVPTSTSTGILISNNIFNNPWGGVGYNINAYNAIITNNIFLATGAAFPATVSGNVISNNIFMRSPTTTGQNVYSNNLTYGVNVTEMPTTGNSGANNILEESPLFVKFPTTIPSIYDRTTMDFHLKSGSPAIGKASDGGDIGIYGGAEPFDLNVGIPLVQQFNTSGVVKQGNNLQVTVKAKSY